MSSKEIPQASMIRTVRLRGMDLLNNPALNKGTAFSQDEHENFGLHGLLPPVIESLDDQVIRAYQAFSLKSNDLERHIYLRQLQDTNEILFYRLLLDHIDEMLPIVYTPVVALGCQEFSHIYRRPRGLFISYPLRHFIPELLRNHPNPEVDVIVVTDGERSASAIKASAASAFPSANFLSIRSSAEFILLARFPSFSTSAPITKTAFAIPNISAGGTRASLEPSTTASSTPSLPPSSKFFPQHFFSGKTSPASTRDPFSIVTAIKC
jgi:hypothetical protein